MSKYFTYILILTTLSISSGTGQSFNKLLKYYQEHNIEAFRSEAQKIDREALEQAPDLQFFYTVLNQNGEEALSEYERLYKSGSQRVRYLAAKKLMEYHYARGYYITASEYEKYLIKHENIILEGGEEKEIVRTNPTENKRDDIEYYIQVGAFSHRDNARQLSEMLKTQNVNCTLVLRTINDRQLFCVWIEGKSTLDQTMEYANRIRERYDLNFRIIKE
jgi:hypothetical protein